MVEEGLEVILQPLVIIIFNILAKSFYELFLGNILRNVDAFEFTIQEFFDYISVKRLLPPFYAYKFFLALAI